MAAERAYRGGVEHDRDGSLVLEYIKSELLYWFTDAALLQPPHSKLKDWYTRELGGAEFLNVPIDDSPDVNLLIVLPEALKFIDEARARHSNILVHCHAGQNRSAAVVVAWMIRNDQALTLQDAITSIDKERSAKMQWHILQNYAFNSALIEYCLSLKRSEDQCRLPPEHWRSI